MDEIGPDAITQDMCFLAHSPNRAGIGHRLREHLVNVANMASAHAAAFEASTAAKIAGLLHDIGKYGDLFQRRLAGLERSIDHWSTGAWIALTHYQHAGLLAALAIQGHHLGLQRGDKDSLRQLDPRTLAKQHPYGMRLSEDDPSALLARFRADGLVLPDPAVCRESGAQGASVPAAAAMLDARMLFSTLVDADYADTEEHFQSRRREEVQLEAGSDLEALLRYVRKRADTVATSQEMARLRMDLLEACLQAASGPTGLYMATAPTGAGKTVSLLAFALKHAQHHGLRRIVTVIPYLSIIDQTATEYRRILSLQGKKRLQRYLREHHSLAGTRPEDRFQDDPDEEHRTAEDWDAPIIITTSVQFLESLHASRPSACRKLHRLARAVVILDEVQNLRLPLVIPTLATLSRLCERYGTTVVLCTATQPAFEHLNESVVKYCPAGWKPRDIVPPQLSLFDKASRRTNVEWPSTPDCRTSWQDVVEVIAATPQVLCVVNLKRHATLLYDLLEERCTENLLHLSTNMCPAHRHAVLRKIRRDLASGKPCRLVSTQCVEAGVDIDFPVVLRAWGPLDAIAQAAGRCNRHGRLDAGRMVVFVPEDEGYPDGAYRQAAVVTRLLWKEHGGIDIHDASSFRDYYRLLYDLVSPDKQCLNLTSALTIQDFAEVSRLYRVIPQDGINVLVPYRPDIYARLREHVALEGFTYRWTQMARPYAVNLFRPKPEDPVVPYLEPVPLGRNHQSDEWYFYLAGEHYHPRKGLIPPDNTACLIG